MPVLPNDLVGEVDRLDRATRGQDAAGGLAGPPEPGAHGRCRAVGTGVS